MEEFAAPSARTDAFGAPTSTREYRSVVLMLACPGISTPPGALRAVSSAPTAYAKPTARPDRPFSPHSTHCFDEDWFCKSLNRLSRSPGLEFIVCIGPSRLEAREPFEPEVIVEL